MDVNAAHFDVVDRALERNLRWIAAADGKIPAVFAINTAMLAVLAALIPEPDKWTTVQCFFSFAAGVALLSSVVCLAIASFPRLKGPTGSVVYFGGIVSLGEMEYIKRITEGSTPELLNDLARQSFRNAEIAKQKYAAVRLSYILTFGSMLPWLIAVALLYSART